MAKLNRISKMRPISFYWKPNVLKETITADINMLWKTTYLKSRIWDPWLLVRPKTPDLKGGTQDLRPRILVLMVPKTQDTQRRIEDTYDRWDPRPKTNIFRQSWDARTIIQMNFSKCAVYLVWVIMFLIFNCIIKRLQHL